MSKSDPNSAIFMEDAREDVDRKIKKAFCPPQVTTGAALHCETQSTFCPPHKRMARRSLRTATLQHVTWACAVIIATK